MLNGRTALVVEEQFLIALDMQRMLEAFGVAHTLFARTAAEVEQFRAQWPEIAVAVVEVSGDPTGALQLIDRLGQAGIATVLTTADLAVFPALRDRDWPILAKPVADSTLASALQQVLARGV